MSPCFHPVFLFIGFCLLLTVSNVNGAETSYDLENLEVNTVFMAANDCCLSSMGSHLPMLRLPKYDLDACSFSCNELSKLVVLKAPRRLFYWLTNTS